MAVEKVTEMWDEMYVGLCDKNVSAKLCSPGEFALVFSNLFDAYDTKGSFVSFISYQMLVPMALKSLSKCGRKCLYVTRIPVNMNEKLCSPVEFALVHDMSVVSVVYNYKIQFVCFIFICWYRTCLFYLNRIPKILLFCNMLMMLPPKKWLIWFSVFLNCCYLHRTMFFVCLFVCFLYVLFFVFCLLFFDFFDFVFVFCFVLFCFIFLFLFLFLFLFFL